MENDEITNRVLLQHIQGMRTAIESRLERVEKRLSSVEGRLGNVEGRLGNIEYRLERVEGGVDFLKGAFTNMQKRHFALSDRTTRLEEKEIPAIKEHVGMTA